jgi:hypothetical protein
MSDFLLDNAEKRLRVLQAAKQRALADLAEHRAEGNDYAAQEQLGALAHLEVEERGIVQMRQDYLRAQNPPPPPRQTPEQLRAKPAEQMSWEDGLQIARNSKYGRDLDFNNPDVVAGFHEANRRRGRGE